MSKQIKEKPLTKQEKEFLFLFCGPQSATSFKKQLCKKLYSRSARKRLEELVFTPNDVLYKLYQRGQRFK